MTINELIARLQELLTDDLADVANAGEVELYAPLEFHRVAGHNNVPAVVWKMADTTSPDEDDRIADLPFLCRDCAYKEPLSSDEYVQATTVEDCDFAEAHSK